MLGYDQEATALDGLRNPVRTNGLSMSASSNVGKRSSSDCLFCARVIGRGEALGSLLHRHLDGGYMRCLSNCTR